jgi:hypothetical protein
MSRAAAANAPPFYWPVRNPWPLLFAGLALTGLALLLASRGGGAWSAARVGLVVAGLILAGGAVSIRLQSASWDADARFQSAGLLALAGLAALLAYPALDADWDSARLLLAVLAGVAVAGAVLVLLPTVARKVVISLLVLYHFGGILSAVLSVAPPNQPASWLTNQVWTRFYRPYLQFMYLNNAYHFYSPDPGPPVLLRFYVEYADGSTREIEVPRRGDFHTQLAYQRRLAMTESTNLNQNQPPPDFEWRWHRRVEAMNRWGIPVYPVQLMHPTMQYREPLPYSKKMIASYARHVARNYPSEKDSGAEVKSVAVYRVVHRILLPGEFVQDRVVKGEAVKAPDYPTTYLPFFLGEFDKDGNLLKADEDPFLYWIIPILDMPKEAPPEVFRVVRPPKPEDVEPVNYVERHLRYLKARRLGRN